MYISVNINVKTYLPIANLKLMTTRIVIFKRLLIVYLKETSVFIIVCLIQKQQPGYKSGISVFFSIKKSGLYL